MLLVADLMSGGMGVASWLFGGRLGTLFAEWVDVRRTEKALSRVIEACDLLRDKLVARQTEALERQVTESTARLAVDLTGEIERVIADYSRTLAAVVRKKRRGRGRRSRPGSRKPGKR